MDLVTSTRLATMPVGSAVDWSTNIPFPVNPPTMAVANLAYSSPGAIKVNYGYLKPAFQSATSFTISCWFRFALTAYWTELYPLFSFTNLWTSDSPLFYISPDARIKFVYKYGSTSYQLDGTLTEIIGIGPWIYITIQYDVTLAKLKVYITSDHYTNTLHEWTVSQTPMFGTSDLWIGSTDMSLAGTASIFKGQIACFVIYSTNLDTTRIDQVKTGCDSLLNGPAATALNDPCTTCLTTPISGLPIPTTNDVDWPIGTVLTYTIPPHWRYPSINDQFLTTECVSPLTWNPSLIPVIDSPISKWNSHKLLVHFYFLY